MKREKYDISVYITPATEKVNLKNILYLSPVFLISKQKEYLLPIIRYQINV